MFSKSRKSAYIKHNSKAEHSNTYGQTQPQVLNIYEGINYKNRAQIYEKCSPKSLNPQEKHTAQISPTASNTNSFHSRANQGSKWVAIERAKLGESSATKIVKNRGWKRRESAVESYDEQ
ncbi:hypothetical protein F511_38091 [Dorcoceras hygrometricum]|uniref:Uncharacterized protein n=1 Tax=Dorcoceras hygrometricum TaxID=472368 RepID=A0A2Z7C6Z8_9LAMI|nr:hypothetical protein F511_38091 [Dorcoceras hygrometricum]